MAIRYNNCLPHLTRSPKYKWLKILKMLSTRLDYKHMREPVAQVGYVLLKYDGD
jgi:hypothetical protein